MLSLLAMAAALAAPVGAPARPEPPPVRIQFEEAEYRYRERRTVMTGKPLVTLTREDAVLVCRRLTAENDERGKLRQATCEGDVRLTRGERVVTCASAVYEEAGARVTCRGSPTIREGPSELSGEELTWELDADRITLTRGKGTLVPPPGQEMPLQGGGRP
jgi:lipopolysaccharide export system protein LptA